MKKNVFLISSVLFISSCAGIQPATPEEAASLNCDPYPDNYKQMIIDYLSVGLYDPMSAQYRFTSPQKAKFKGGCGWYIASGINAKNRFGGYVGEKKSQFIIHKGKLQEINQFQSEILNSLNQ